MATGILSLVVPQSILRQVEFSTYEYILALPHVHSRTFLLDGIIPSVHDPGLATCKGNSRLPERKCGEMHGIVFPRLRAWDVGEWMKLFFVGEIHYSALCLESILNEGIPVDRVLTTRSTNGAWTDLALGVDARLMRRMGYEEGLYSANPQRFLRCRVPAALLHEFGDFDNDLFEYLVADTPGLVVVAGLSKRVPERFLHVPRYGFVNLHPSLLPKYRGPSPEFYAIQNGETHSGLTLHRMDSRWDTGAILAQARFTVSEEDCVGDMERKAGAMAGRLLKAFLENMQDPGIPQRSEEGTYYRAYCEDDLLVDWSSSAEAIQKLVRAKPEGYAFTHLEGERIYITHSRIETAAPKTGTGSIFRVDDQGAYVRCGSGSLVIQNAVYGKGIKKYLCKPAFRNGMVLG